MPTIELPEEGIVQALQERVRGDVLTPGDDGYEAARTVWNGMIDRHPSTIVRCTGTADVIATVDFVRDHDLTFSVKAGGHSVAGHAVCDGGVVIDLSGMNWVHVDPESKTARVGPGALLGDLDHETTAFGLATTMGVASITGVAGLTLGGGNGYLGRAFGLACDNLRSADVVTADGELVHASDESNPDLFWAIRGGGGNFGVVTAMEFELHEVGPEVLAGPVFYTLDDAVEVLRFYRDFVADAPDEVSCLVSFTHVPPVEPFPPAHQGETAIALVPFYAGAVEDGESALAPLRSIVEPVFDGVAPVPYTALQGSFDEATPPGGRYYWKAEFLQELTDEAIETLVDLVDPLPAAMTSVSIESLGGAIASVAPDATAYRHREAAFDLGIWAGWSDPDRDEELIEWAREFHETMAPYGSNAVYVNYLDHDDEDRIRAAYGENYDRLARIKAEYDPENLFSANKNVEPAGRSEA